MPRGNYYADAQQQHTTCTCTCTCSPSDRKHAPVSVNLAGAEEGFASTSACTSAGARSPSTAVVRDNASACVCTEASGAFLSEVGGGERKEDLPCVVGAKEEIGGSDLDGGAVTHLLEERAAGANVDCDGSDGMMWGGGGGGERERIGGGEEREIERRRRKDHSRKIHNLSLIMSELFWSLETPEVGVSPLYAPGMGHGGTLLFPPRSTFGTPSHGGTPLSLVEGGGCETGRGGERGGGERGEERQRTRGHLATPDAVAPSLHNKENPVVSATSTFAGGNKNTKRGVANGRGHGNHSMERQSSRGKTMFGIVYCTVFMCLCVCVCVCVCVIVHVCRAVSQEKAEGGRRKGGRKGSP